MHSLLLFVDDGQDAADHIPSSVSFCGDYDAITEIYNIFANAILITIITITAAVIAAITTATITAGLCRSDNPRSWDAYICSHFYHLAHPLPDLIMFVQIDDDVMRLLRSCAATGEFATHVTAVAGSALLVLIYFPISRRCCIMMQSHTTHNQAPL